MTIILKISVVLQFALRFQSSKYIYIFIFIFVCCQTSNLFRGTYRIFYIVACNYSILVKRFGIFPNLLLLLLFRYYPYYYSFSWLAVGLYLLRDYHWHHYQTSIQYRPYLWENIFQLSALIVITVKELWPNKEIYVLIHISKTTHSIFNCSTSTGSPSLTLNFRKLQRNRQTY